MNHTEIREKFLKYFESKGHTIVPSSSLLPTDPSVLFTTAGMQQFKPYYTGAADAIKDFGSLNTATIQKSMRTSDIDEVGDGSHLTFFEMLGNFSFGGYWKKEAIQYAHEFITKEMGLKIDYVSVFGGEGDIPADEESERFWKDIDPNIEVKKFGRADNFWGPTGNEGPCGPTTEVYVNGLEVWNVVFNQYYQDTSGKLEPLKTQGIDTGMGLERLAMVAQDKKTIFETDLLQPLMSAVIEILGDKPIGKVRLIADHLRAAVFLISDGVEPSKSEQGYVLRRLIRRAMVAHYMYIGASLDTNFFLAPFREITRIYGREAGYKDLLDKEQYILDILGAETKKFSKTLENGMKILSKEMKVFDVVPGKKLEYQDLSPIQVEGRLFPVFTPVEITGKWLFDFYQSFGFPYELTLEILHETLGREKLSDYELNELKREFEEEFKKHQEKSRAGAEKKFGGHGIAVKEGDLSAQSQEELAIKTRLHTATHLLHAALRKVLGNEVHQQGSDITAERLRFDFNFSRKLTAEEITKIENWVNDVISKDVPVTKEEMTYDGAIKSGAMAFFKQKYPGRVNVYSVGEYSKELCGGPHVSHTGEIGKFKISKEEAVSAGVRRIRAIIE